MLIKCILDRVLWTSMVQLSEVHICTRVSLTCILTIRLPVNYSLTTRHHFCGYLCSKCVCIWEKSAAVRLFAIHYDVRGFSCLIFVRSNRLTDEAYQNRNDVCHRTGQRLYGDPVNANCSHGRRNEVFMARLLEMTTVLPNNPSPFFNLRMQHRTHARARAGRAHPSTPSIMPVNSSPDVVMNEGM